MYNNVTDWYEILRLYCEKKKNAALTEHIMFYIAIYSLIQERFFGRLLAPAQSTLQQP